jgi:putative ABC transport system ATP-binding protein
MHHVPSEMSGGQQQRAAVARAIVTNPALILADEPTGNLDTESSLDVMSVFAALHAQGRTVVLITHEEDIAAYAQRVVKLRDGRIVDDHASGRGSPPAAPSRGPRQAGHAGESDEAARRRADGARWCHR